MSPPCWTLPPAPAYTGTVGVLAVVLVAATMATPAFATSPLLERIELVGDPPIAVRLHVSAPTTSHAQALAADGAAPERIYVDLADTRLAAPFSTEIDTPGALLLRIRAAQYDPHTARVVLDLTDRTPFRVVGGERTVTIELLAEGRPVAPPPRRSAARLPVPPAPPAPKLTRAAAPAVDAAAPIPPGDRPPASSSMIPTAKVSSAPPAETTPEEEDTAPPAVASAAPSLDAPPPSPPPAATEPAERPAPPAAGPPARAQEPEAPAMNARSRFPLVVLDAGHGGRDPGAAGVGGVLEKDVVLELTLLVARRLAARLPVDVLMTRTDDSYIPIERRVASENAALFISLHANACTSPSARGLEVFYGGGTLRTASSGGGDWRAALLGRCLDQALQARIGGVRGHARPAGFVVLARNPAPSALVEIGYLTHPDEAARAQDRHYHEVLADALVDGIAAFLRASAPPL